MLPIDSSAESENNMENEYFQDFKKGKRTIEEMNGKHLFLFGSM